MQKNKSLTLDGMTIPNAIHVIVNVAIIGVSIYLTNHYFETLFPTKLGGGSTLCDISSFWNCDSATYSSISNIASIPISFFSIVLGAMFLVGTIFPSLEYERTSKLLSALNLVGVLVLFVYSLVSLGSLCPFCTVYYVLSIVNFFLFYKFGVPGWTPGTKQMAAWGVILAVGAFVMKGRYDDKLAKQNSVNTQIVAQYYNLKNHGDPTFESPYKIHMATEKFSDAPIRISVFSDFQCPFCQVVSDQLHKLVRQYKDTMNIQYMFYPLDSACNSEVKGNFHPFACKAAYVSACDEKKFAKVHDDIFAKQKELSHDTLKKIMNSNGLSGCYDKPELKEIVKKTIAAGDQYKVRSTPTIIVNGVKIEGTIPNSQFMALFDEILKRAGK